MLLLKWWLLSSTTKKKGTHVTLGTDYGLVEVKLALEGELELFGIPRTILAGDTLKQKHHNLVNMTSCDFMGIVKEKVLLPPRGPWLGDHPRDIRTCKGW